MTTRRQTTNIPRPDESRPTKGNRHTAHGASPSTLRLLLRGALGIYPATELGTVELGTVEAVRH